MDLVVVLDICVSHKHHAIYDNFMNGIFYYL